MTNAFTKKQIALAVSCALALGVLSGVARAEGDVQTKGVDMGYLVNQQGSVVVSGFGLCWHSGVGPAPTSPPMECGGAAPAPTAAAEPAPKPQPIAAAAPAPKPAPAPVVQRITLDADTLFDFDKSVLRPAGKTALDDFVVKLDGIKPEVINAVGYTDRFGTEAYNQRLSERRVLAVRTYLVTKGIESSRIHTEGKGETQPVTKAGECDGAKSKKVIACLQPDRRVEVEVIGNRVDKLTLQQ
jgi:OOP family OmpA-OmpF porin